MIPNFPAFNIAWEWTIKFYHPNVITEHLRRSGGEVNLEHVDKLEGFAYGFQSSMEFEINQHIATSNEFVKKHLQRKLEDAVNNLPDPDTNELIRLAESNRETSEAPFDIVHITEYYYMMLCVVQNFKNIADKYIDWLKSEPQNRVSLPTINTPPKPVDHGKMKFTLTVEQIAFLFRILKENKMISATSAAEIMRFITHHFTAKNTVDAISLKNLTNAYSSPSATTATYWIAELRKLINIAKETGK